MRAPIYIFEGTWWKNAEVPLVLPYFQALAGSHGDIDLSHRTIRSADDIVYYVKKLPTRAQAFLYFTCHGEGNELFPSGRRSCVSRAALLDALSIHKPGAISFLHFGCCEMIDHHRRRHSLEELLEASGAKWVSGYAREVSWLPSTMLDLAIASEVFVPFHQKRRRRPKLQAPARNFLRDYEQLARSLGFSALSRAANGRHQLFPARLSAKR